MSEESIEERLSALENAEERLWDMDARVQDLESEFETMRTNVEDHITEDTDDTNEPE